MRRSDAIRLLALSAIWGSSFIFIAGVALVSRAGPVVPDFWFWISVLACLGSTTCYALSSIYMKKRAAHLKPLAIAAWSQIFAGVVLLPLLPFTQPSAPLTPLIAFN